MKDAEDLNLELNSLEIKKSDLEAEIKLLAEGIVDLKENLETATDDRKVEHDNNVEQIMVASGGCVLRLRAATLGRKR
eukprot:8671512-Heterocapsa_arctica.AAC.1